MDLSPIFPAFLFNPGLVPFGCGSVALSFFAAIFPAGPSRLNHRDTADTEKTTRSSVSPCRGVI